MASWTITIPSGEVNDYVSAFSESWDPAGGVTQTNFAKANALSQLKATKNSYLKKVAAKVATDAVADSQATIA